MPDLETLLSQASGGDIDAQYAVGVLYLSGLKLAMSTEAAAQRFLNRTDDILYNERYCIDQDYDGDDLYFEPAFRWLQKAAEGGHAGAQTLLGIMYRDGYGTDVDLDEAFKWFSAAAKQGDGHAQQELGEMYLFGDGVKRKALRGVKLLEKAAEQDVPRALYRMAQLSAATNLPVGYREAETLFRKAAELNYTAAKYSLARMYLQGDGVEKDYRLGSQLLCIAASEGDRDAQYAIASMYRNGDGIVVQNTDEAVYWYRLAADQGNMYAQYDLGEMYLAGEGVTRDVDQAVSWFRRSAGQGNDEAQQMLDQLLGDHAGETDA